MAAGRQVQQLELTGGKWQCSAQRVAMGFGTLDRKSEWWAEIEGGVTTLRTLDYAAYSFDGC
jgi:hypothetical protein